MKKFTEEEFVPIENWGKDHWSLLGYIGHVMIECAGFQIGFDPRMSQNRRNYRVMLEQCPNPRRHGSNRPPMGGCMYKAEYKARLRDAEAHDNHDDHGIVQDMAEAEFFIMAPSGKPVDSDYIQPGHTIFFSDKGRKYYDALTKHKQEGGNFSNFNMEESVS